MHFGFVAKSNYTTVDKERKFKRREMCESKMMIIKR